MKKILTAILFLLAFASMNAQEYSFEITSESGDSTFQLDEITELSDTRFEINRTTGLDTTSLQQIQYAKIARLYNDIAKKEQEIFAAKREISSLRLGLISVGLEDYNSYQLNELDSLYATDSAILATTSGIRAACYIQAREGLTSVVKLISDNSVVATIVPLAPNYIRLNLQPEYQPNGVTNVWMYAKDTRFFRGIDENNVRFILRIR